MIPYCWQFKNESIEILPQKGKALNVFGIMDSNGKELKTFTKEGTIKAEFIINAIDEFVLTLKKMTVLILDNARIHHSKIFQEKKQKWEDVGLYIFYLPAYSPHLNRIEILWRQVKYRWIKPDDYQNLDTLKNALNLIWNSFGNSYMVHFSKN